MNRIKATMLGLALVLVGVVVGGETAMAFQGHMFAAQSDLRMARNQLSIALPDKAGHRVAAIGLVDQALAQVNAGIGAGAR